MATERGNDMPANSIKFADLCAVLQKLHKTKTKQDKYNLLKNFIDECRMKCAGKKNSSIFPVLRLLLPKEERERSAYNMKESKLGALLVKVLSLSKESSDGRKLLGFRSVSNTERGDFPGVAYYVLRNRVGAGARRGGATALDVGDINEILDKIATAEVGNKGPALDEAMSYAIKNLNAEEMTWLLRIMLKDLKLGVGSPRALAAFHPDAPDLYNSIGNLSKVCEELSEGETRAPEAGIQVFYAVSPMLAERLDVTRAASLTSDATKTYQIETKFDGERFQMHMSDGVFEYFSRKGYSWSATYGRGYDAAGGLLTPRLRGCFGDSVTSFILDGEMMGWHKQHQCLGSKGMAFDVKKITENSKFRPCFCAFDLLMYNGRALVGPPGAGAGAGGGAPLAERLRILDTMFTDVPGVILHSKRTLVTQSVDILDALNKVIEDQDEGIVVKDTASYYMANRRNAGWYKVKPEYTEGAMTDLDLVVVGADEAENKRQGRARSFLLACADRAAPGQDFQQESLTSFLICVSDAPPHRWVCVGRVATGLSHEERERVCAHLERHWVPSRRAPPPPALVLNKEKCDFWILPEHSVVLQIRASELVRSPHSGTSHTLRFPRVVRVRDDKPVCDVITLDEFNQLVADKGLVTKLGTKRINEDQMSEVEAKSRRKRAARVLRVPEQFRARAGAGAGAGEGEGAGEGVRSAALRGREVCVLTDGEGEGCSKPELVRVVESHGGRHVENVGPDTWCCVVGRVTYRARQLIASREVDAISACWLRALPPADTPCTLSPLDMLAVRKSTALALSAQYDRFGDSYTEPADESTLRKCFHKMATDEPEIYLTNEEMLSVDRELFDGHNPHSFLRPCAIHFVGEQRLNSIQARMYGASVCDVGSPNLTHVVLPEDTSMEDVARYKGNSKASTVSVKWLTACLTEGRLVSETEFLL